jgi:glycosyltransferase involved in cell wall biosynthesis
MVKMKDTLIFFSERYPHEFIGGLYEEMEIKELEKYFKQIIVISTSKRADQDSSFYIPENIISKNFNTDLTLLQKLWSIRLIVSSDFFKEYFYIKQTLKLKINIKILVIALIEMQKARSLVKSVEKLLKAQQLDVNETLIYSFWNDFRAYAAVLLKRKLNISRAISRAHGGDVYYERHPFNYLPFKGVLHEELDGIFPISKSSENYLKEKLSVSGDKIKFFHLGISNKIPFNFKSNQTILNIVSCSHIVKIKRVELIAEGLNELKEIGFHWYHIGGDYMGNIVKRFCEQNFNNKNQQYSLLGSLNNNEIMDFYSKNQIDLFINLSQSEGVPVSIMEAMSFGIPVIATNVGSTSEIVKDGITGFLLSPNPSLLEIKQVISKYYFLSLKEKKIMSENAYNCWKNEFNADENYSKFAETIINL